MDEKTFFSLFAFLLVIGVFSSLFTGVALPIAPSLAVSSTSTCTPNPAYCGTPSLIDAIPCGLTAVYCFLMGGISLMVAGFVYFGQMIAFLTGLTALTGGGSLALPAPLDFIAALLIMFAWIFIASEVLRRFVGIVWGR